MNLKDIMDEEEIQGKFERTFLMDSSLLIVYLIKDNQVNGKCRMPTILNCEMESDKVDRR